MLNNLNYDNFSSKDLCYILKDLKNNEISVNFCDEKIREILNVLILKYLNEVEDFNIYLILNEYFRYLYVDSLTGDCIDNSFISSIIDIIEKDFKNINNVNENNLKYLFELFIRLFENEYYLNSYISKIDILLNNIKNLKSLKIENSVLRQQINEFIKKVNNVKSSLDDNSTNNDVISDKSDKKEEQKVFKFLKSKVVHSEMRNILCNFSLFNEKDQISIIDVIGRKKWHDCLYQNQFIYFTKNIVPIFKILKENVDTFKIYINNGSNISPINFLISAIKSRTIDIKEFYSVFDVNNLNDFLIEIGKWYSEFDGVSEEGKETFIRFIILSNKSNLNYSYSKKIEDNEINNAYIDLCYNDFKKFNSVFSKYKGSNLSKLNVTCSFPEYYIKNDGIFISFNEKENKYVEKIFNSVSTNTVLDYMMEILMKNNNVLYNIPYFIFRKNSNTEVCEFINDKIKEVVSEYLDIILSFKIIEDDFDLKLSICKYLKLYLNCDLLDKDLSLKIIKNASVFNKFSKCISYHSSVYGELQNSFKDEMVNEKLTLLINSIDLIDFNNKEDLLSVIYMGIVDSEYCLEYEINSIKQKSIFSKIINGLKDNFDDIYNLILYYYEGIDKEIYDVKIANHVLLFINQYFCK